MSIFDKNFPLIVFNLSIKFQRNRWRHFPVLVWTRNPICLLWRPSCILYGHKFHNFGRGLNANYNYLNSLTAWYPGVEKKIFKDCINFSGFGPRNPIWLLWQPSCFLYGHKFHNFGKGLNADYNYVNSLTAWCPGVEKKIFKDCINFIGFGPTPQAQGGAPGGQGS